MSEKSDVKILELLAVILAATFVWAPLAIHPIQQFIYPDGNQGGSQTPNPDRILAWLTLFVLVFQAWVYLAQRKIMIGQLEANRVAANAAKTAADAALAGLDRPWLVIEHLNDSRSDWLGGAVNLTAGFRVGNYGKAPAFIKTLTVSHFIGPHHHNGWKHPERPERMLDFPDADSLATFLQKHGRGAGVPRTSSESNDAGVSRLTYGGVDERAAETWIAVPAQTSVGPFMAVAANNINIPAAGIPFEALSESYLVGQLFYEVPGQGYEIMTFCYKHGNTGGFELYRDYSPYNERKKAKLN